jgi:hypothetical protein
MMGRRVVSTQQALVLCNPAGLIGTLLIKRKQETTSNLIGHGGACGGFHSRPDTPG